MGNIVIGDKNSVLKVLDDKMTLIKNHFGNVDTSFELDEISTIIAYTLVHNKEKTYTQEFVSVEITIPATVTQGFIAGLNVVNGDTEKAISFVNNSSFLDNNFKIIKFGQQITSYTASANKVIQMVFMCDGLNLYCYIIEV